MGPGFEMHPGDQGTIVFAGKLIDTVSVVWLLKAA